MSASPDPLKTLRLDNPMLKAPFTLLDIQERHIAVLTKYGIVQKALTTIEDRKPETRREPILPPDLVGHLAIGRTLDENGTLRATGLHVSGRYYLGGDECELEVFASVTTYPVPGVIQEVTPFTIEEATLVHQLGEELAVSGLPGLNPNLIDFDWLGQPPMSMNDMW